MQSLVFIGYSLTSAALLPVNLQPVNLQFTFRTQLIPTWYDKNAFQYFYYYLNLLAKYLMSHLNIAKIVIVKSEIRLTYL